MTVEHRFWSKVDRSNGPDECWIWNAYRQKGYGRFGINGRGVLAHRYSYETLVGPIPPGMHLDHLCRNPPCVNPAHLEPVTPRENWWRSDAPTRRNAVRTHCPQGHPYDETNTILYRGSRYCRRCLYTRNKVYRQRSTQLCALEGCDKRSRGARLCGMHNMRRLRQLQREAA